MQSVARFFILATPTGQPWGEGGFLEASISRVWPFCTRATDPGPRMALEATSGGWGKWAFQQGRERGRSNCLREVRGGGGDIAITEVRTSIMEGGEWPKFVLERDELNRQHIH